MSDESLNGTTCRLIREDGSEWIVTRFELREGGAWITARRVPADTSLPSVRPTDLEAHPGPGATHPGNGHGNGNGSGHGNGNGNGAERLFEAPLRHGDRLVWTRQDGSVAWAMRNPTGVGIEWSQDDVDDDEFFAGDFR
jgi:hypothetical protein